MSFGQPLWCIALALLPALAALFFRNERRRSALLRQLVAARLQDRLAGSVSAVKRRWRFGILLLGLASVILSLAQPRLGYTWEESRRKGRDVIIAIDCSRSMLSTDLTPNRLTRAKLAAQDLIGLLGGDRVGLIAFAGTAFLQAPLTADYGAVLNALSELDTDIIPRGGTDITAAIKEASDAFGKGESDNRCLILMTDGEDLEEDSISAARDQNGTIRIFTVGLGSTDGSLIPLPGSHGDAQFVKDENGEIVKSRLDEERLRKIAETTGGFYVHLLSGPAEMKQIATEGLGKMNEKDIDIKMSRRPIERYQWPLAAGIALIAGAMLIGERKRLARRATVSAAAALTMLLPRAAEAKNSGLDAYDRQDYGDAQEQFSNQLKRLPDSQGLQFDLGAAAYKSGDYGKALEAFAKAVTSTDQPMREAAEYNLGNTLYQRGAAQKDKEPKIKEWKNALQHYDQALNLDPQNKDARYNRDLVQRLIDDLEKEEKQQQQQQQQKDKNKDKDKKDDKDQNQDQQQQQNGKNQKDPQKGSQQDQQQNPSQSQKGGQQDQQQQQQSGNSKPDKGGLGQQQEKKDQGSGDQKNAQNQPKEEKGGEQAKNEPQQRKNEPQQGKNEPQQGKDGKDSQEKKPSGEIKAQESSPKQDLQKQEAEEAQAAREGKMTETQAKELLDSLKGEDQRVQLLKPDQRKNNSRSFKDW